MKMRLRKLGEVLVLILSIGLVLGAIYLSGRAYAAPHRAVDSHTIGSYTVGSHAVGLRKNISRGENVVPTRLVTESVRR